METIGGQAVIEGVMIRNKNKIATAVIKDKEIIIKLDDFVSLTEKHRVLRFPVLRGIINFFETLKIGIGALNYSADIFQADNVEAGKNVVKKKKSDIGFYAMFLFSFLIGIGIFLFSPIYITTKLFNIEKTALSFNLATGIMRILFFIAYVYVISYMKDVKRLFMYHGAEHKVVNCYEHGEKVTLKNARKYSTVHKRCGTSFLFMMFLIAILSFSFIDLAVSYFLGYTNIVIRLVTHLLFLPVVFGIAYELLKYAASKNNWLLSFVAYPGALLQRITTAEPSDEMINVAMAALHKIV